MQTLLIVNHWECWDWLQWKQCWVPNTVLFKTISVFNCLGMDKRTETNSVIPIFRWLRHYYPLIWIFAYSPLTPKECELRVIFWEWENIIKSFHTYIGFWAGFVCLLAYQTYRKTESPAPIYVLNQTEDTVWIKKGQVSFTSKAN